MKYQKITALSVLSVFLISGCSQDEKLPGRREILFKNTEIQTAIDKTPVIVETTVNYRDFSQPYLNSSHTYAPLAFSLNPKQIWSFGLDYEANKVLQNTASPLVAEGKVFGIDAAGIVYALDKKTGKRLWRVSTNIIEKDGQIGCAMAYYNGRLLVSSSYSEMFSLDAKTGKILWRIKLPALCKGDGITIANGQAFVACSNSSMNAIDIDTGKILWTHSGMVSDSIFIGSAGACFDNGVLYAAYPSGEIFALHAENGSVLWDSMISKFSLTDMARSRTHIRACPVIKDGRLYVVSSAGQTVALDPETGLQIWSSDFGGLQTPIVSGNSVFVQSFNAELVCLNKDTGALRWKTVLSNEKNPMEDWYGQLLIKDHILSISAEGEMTLVSVTDGKIKKRVKLSDKISVNPVIADETMYLLTDSNICAYR